ncbi:hypothetical protein LNKW23_28490 [Paralimibaculum aggregatum]|uniref:Flagellar hook-length control protein-like C-terminal domain-containing protein n=1 Tax=Paralimibaculum aggregatum TaxID=3036245 RepID=A0ABQ6LMG8_9RHOB|nr:flagellar hook-length control protein FliK [Limibaculum sp. NKW23]GMG83636.1 hypothetical protein LNKW23_28490 [Limibaculum sp. NKW23]
MEFSLAAFLGRNQADISPNPGGLAAVEDGAEGAPAGAPLALPGGFPGILAALGGAARGIGPAAAGTATAAFAHPGTTGQITFGPAPGDPAGPGPARPAGADDLAELLDAVSEVLAQIRGAVFGSGDAADRAVPDGAARVEAALDLAESGLLAIGETLEPAPAEFGTETRLEAGFEALRTVLAPLLTVLDALEGSAWQPMPGGGAEPFAAAVARLRDVVIPPAAQPEPAASAATAAAATRPMIPVAAAVPAPLPGPATGPADNAPAKEKPAAMASPGLRGAPDVTRDDAGTVAGKPIVQLAAAQPSIAGPEGQPVKVFPGMSGGTAGHAGNAQAAPVQAPEPALATMPKASGAAMLPEFAAAAAQTGTAAIPDTEAEIRAKPGSANPAPAVPGHAGSSALQISAGPKPPPSASMAPPAREPGTAPEGSGPLPAMRALPAEAAPAVKGAASDRLKGSETAEIGPRAHLAASGRGSPELAAAPAPPAPAMPPAAPAIPSGADAASAPATQSRFTGAPEEPGPLSFGAAQVIGASGGSAAAPLAAAAVSGSAEIARAVAPQIATAIAAQQAPGRVELRLDPPELGRIEVSLEIADQGLRATLLAERQPTAELMRRHGEILLQELQNAGFADIDLRFSGGGRHGGQRLEPQQALPAAGDSETLQPAVAGSQAGGRSDRLDMRL